MVGVISVVMARIMVGVKGDGGGTMLEEVSVVMVGLMVDGRSGIGGDGVVIGIEGGRSLVA